MTKQDRFSYYTHSEGRTGLGEVVEFSCRVGEVEKVKEFLQENVRTIRPPVTGQAIGHGGYGHYTRYEVTQHKYAGGSYEGGWGYIEALEVKNPPDGRWGIVIHERTGHNGSVFTEWENLEHALAAWEKFWGSSKTAEEFPKLPGFKRLVKCGAMMPWFYAIGEEKLVGDYAFPEGLQDDAVYRFGNKFVVMDSEEVPEIKTCMGTRFVTRKRDYYPYDVKSFRLVYWDDGSVWDESQVCDTPPRPIEEGEMWIAEAVQQFRALLAGKSTEFAINFTDGNKFVGKLVRAEQRVPSAEGDYLLVVRFKGEKKGVKGWVNDFKPTPEAPDVVQYVMMQYAKKGQEVECVEVKEVKTKKNGKKWVGAFFRPSS